MVRRKQPSLLLHLSRVVASDFRDNPSVLLSPESTTPPKQQKKAWISAGTLPLLRIGDIWRAGRLEASPEYQLESFADLQINQSTTHLVKAGLNLDEQGFLLPISEHPWHMQCTHSYCVMVLFELFQTEDNPVYQELQISNGNRQYDFLRSIITASVAADKRFLSQHVIKALNFQAITCLHTNPGEYRPCPVEVGPYRPPEHYQIPALMDDFVNSINSGWEKSDPIVLAALVLWRLNYIHPFINGNGRTARAICYFVLCLRVGFWLPGETILPELIRQRRDDYVVALRAVDESLHNPELAFNISPLHALLSELLQEQLASAGIPVPPQEGGDEVVPA